jgi:GntR family transcriptional regulator, transcriptional repressor for pyruvate dehydrogenase complex
VGGEVSKKIADVPYEQLRKDVLSERIAHMLLNLIKEKQLRPGDRLPPERELAAMMQVSRPSLREALRALQIMNIIDNRQGSGTYITSLEPERLIEHLDIIFTLNDATYSELFEARKILEAGVAALAAGTISDGVVGELEHCLDRALIAIDDPEAFLEIDLELHRKILEATGNTILSLFMRSISQLSIYSRRRTGERLEVRRQTIEDHRTIVQALKLRDPAAARGAMLDHLSHIEQAMKQMKDEKQES